MDPYEDHGPGGSINLESRRDPMGIPLRHRWWPVVIAVLVGLFVTQLDPLIIAADSLGAVASLPTLGSLPHIAARS
jgi:hypothetical protein